MTIPAVVKTAIRIALIDTDPLRVIGFRNLLESQRDMEVIAISFRQITTEENVHLLLLEDRPGQHTLCEIHGLKAMRPDLPVIVVSPSCDYENILNFIIAGAKGYLFEGVPASELAQAIRSVLRGLVWAPRRVLSMFVERTSEQPKQTVPRIHEPFTYREGEVLRMLVKGLSNKEIAKPLGIEERTVKAHISKIMSKTGVRNRIGLSMHAIANSMVTFRPDDSGICSKVPASGLR
jgi:DNA-binding NarL/FixJ family response regulator